MDIKCPHCGTEYEVEKKNMYRYTKCNVCGKGFVIGAATSLLSDMSKRPLTSVSSEATPMPSSQNRTAPIPSSRPFANIDNSRVNTSHAIPKRLQIKQSKKDVGMLPAAQMSKKHVAAYCVFGGMTAVVVSLVCIMLFKNSLHHNGEPSKFEVEKCLAAREGSATIVPEDQETTNQENNLERTDSEQKGQSNIPQEVSNEKVESTHMAGVPMAVAANPPQAQSSKDEDVGDVVERICDGKRLTYKDWKKLVRKELGFENLSNALKSELKKAGYWAIRIESSGMSINVGRLTDSTTGFVREGLGGGFTYPKWLPEEDAEYIYKAFCKLDAEERTLEEKSETYDLAFKESEFYISPEEEERIEQASRLEFAKPLFESLCFDQERYFYIQKRLGLSVVSAKVTDRRWRLLSEARSNENWLEMMNIIEGDEDAKKFEKFPDENKIVSSYNKLLHYNFNVEVKFKNSGVCSPFADEVSKYRNIGNFLRHGMSESEVRERYNYGQKKGTYDKYKKFSAALKVMNKEVEPYPIDLEVRVEKVEPSGDIKHIRHYNPNRPFRREGSSSVSFQFSIGDGTLYLLFVDDEWYWMQGFSEALRVKMSKYVAERNAFYSEMEKLGKAIHEQKQYTKEEALSLYKEITDKYRKTLLSAISAFMGRSVVLPPDYKRPPETKKNQRRYVSLHKTDDSVISERDVSSYSLFGKGNRFEEYKQKRMEDQKIEQRERKMRDERGKEGVRERMSTKRERERMSTKREREAMSTRR